MQKRIFTISVSLLLMGFINYAKAGCEPNWGFSNATDIQPTSFTANWTFGGTDATYDVLIREAFTFSDYYTVVTGITGLNCTITNLAPGKNYYARIVRHCGGGTDWSTSPNNITTVNFTPGIIYCFGFWYGVKSYLPHARSIDINWAGGDGAEYYVDYKASYGGSWTEEGPFTGSSYTISGLDPGTSYDVKVLKNCQGSWSESSYMFPITTYPAECAQPKIDLMSVLMMDMNTAKASISFSTDYSSGNTYEIFLYKKQPGSQDILYSHQYLYGSGTYTFTLPAGASYELLAAGTCADNGLTSSWKSFEFNTNTNINQQSCLAMSGVWATHRNVTSSSAVIDYAKTIYMNQWHSYYLAYKIVGTAAWSTTPIVENQDLNNSTSVPMNFTGLQPGTKYQYAVIETVRLKSGIICYGGLVETFQFSNTGTFTTVGQCGSTNGDFTAPAYSNSGESLLYSGTITSASPVTQSSQQLQFNASSVVLLPGFVTTVSGTGSFLARIYDLANCQPATRSGVPAAGNDTLPAETAKKVFISVFAGKQALQSVSGSINVYPNPASGIVNLQLNNPNELVNQVMIMDVSGRIVRSINKNVKTIDLAKLANGIYFYKVITNSGTYSGKIQKQ